MIFSLIVAAGWRACAAAEKHSREELLADAHVAEPIALPVPHDAISLPDDWDRSSAGISLRLSEKTPGNLWVRRVSHGDGQLYLEVRAGNGSLAGNAEVKLGDQSLFNGAVKESIWLSLKPKIGTIAIHVTCPGDQAPQQLVAPTTLVEVRGRQLYLNSEPFLLKGATGSNLTTDEAAVVHALGLNTLRGLATTEDGDRYGFMSITSLNMPPASVEAMRAPNSEIQQTIDKSLEWLKDNSAPAIASPHTLILQLGNEKTGSGPAPPGAEALTRARRHVSQLLAAARNFAKQQAPMLPDGYANQDWGFLTPDCMDVYMHNSFLDKDRYGYDWDDFLKWQGCLPPDGPGGQGRPFVNSEFGANRYLPQAYHGGPNNPVLEKIHAWNFPNRWAEFMQHGTVGGSIYCLRDLDKPRDQGCSCFGIFTSDRKPKLACWDIGHMWRDFDVSVKDSAIMISLKRDYWARECKLTLTNVEGKTVTRSLDDFSPRSSRSIALADMLPGATTGFRWTMDFTTHSGLVNKAAGAWPTDLEERDFLDRLKSRDAYPFLRELFDTEVLTADAKRAPRTLADMTNADGIIPVALRKRNGVTYLVLIARENPEKVGPIRGNVNIDVAFSGSVVKVNDMTGEALNDDVNAEPTSHGMTLKNVLAARIPGAIGARSDKPFMVPVYRITP